MLTENGSLQLQDFTDRNFQEAFTQVTEGVWHVSGLGHSNAVVLEGNTGVILIAVSYTHLTLPTKLEV